MLPAAKQELDESLPLLPDDMLFWAEKLSGNGFWAHPLASNRVYLSPGAQQLYGDRTETGWTDWQDMLDYYHPDDQRRVRLMMLDYGGGRGAAPRNFSARIMRGQNPTEERILHHRMVLRPGQNGGMAVRFGIIRDDTEVEQTRRSLIAARKQAEINDRAKTSVITTMNHELRTPLNAILGFAELMSRQIHGPLGHDRYRGYARDIRASGHYLLGLIDDILDLAHLYDGTARLDCTDVAPCDIIARARLIAAGHGAGPLPVINERHDPVPVLLHVDRRALLQMMVHVLENALRHTDQYGRIDIGSACEPDGSLIIWVSDSGCGIKPDDLPRMILPFERGDTAIMTESPRVPERAGLGLTLVKSLMAAHQGTMRLFSRPRHGTVVTLVFPPHRVYTKN